MKCHLIVSLLGALALAAPVHAESYLDRTFGTPAPSGSPRSVALGGAASALTTGAYDLTGNPALLARARGSRLQLGLGLARISEGRFVPLFDTFDSFVEEAEIAVNDHAYPAAQLGAVLDPKWGNGLMIAVGQFDRYDPRYDHFDERRTTATSDAILAERVIRTRGVLRSTSLGAGLPVAGRATLGVAVHWYSGRIEDHAAIVPRGTGVSAADTLLERKLSGPSATFGASLTASERLDFGFSYETGAKLHDDFARWENGVLVSPPAANRDVHLPHRFQGGLAYRPRNSFRTTFVADLVVMPWSNTGLLGPEGERLRDTWEARFGLEHVYYNTLPGRIGFRYARSPAMRDADRAAFTLGIGFQIDRIRLDVSSELAKRTSRQPALWPRDPQYTAIGAGRDRVEDTTVRIVLGAQVDL